MNILKKAGQWLAAKGFSVGDVGSYRRLLGLSSTGRPVTPNGALQLATVWACVRLVSETISSLPLQLYQKNASDDGRSVARLHALYSILHDSPNANMTAVEFWEAIVAQMCLWGNAYCLKVRSVTSLISLELLRPDLMVVKRLKTGALQYCYSDPNGYQEYTEDEIFHVKGFGLDGLIGLSPVSYARNCFGAAMAADDASGKVFANGMRPGGALTMPQLLTKDQRKLVREGMATDLAGTSNTGKLMVLEGGASYVPLGINPDDAQMLETRSFNIEEICRWFRVPPSMVGHGTAASNWGTGLEQQMIGFLTFALRPYLTRIEQAIKKSLLTAVERQKYFAEFSIEGLMRADSAARAAFYASAAQNGWLTRNEIRALENWPAKDGGDELTVQSNLIPLSLLGKITNTAQTAKAAILSWLGIDTSKDQDET